MPPYIGAMAAKASKWHGRVEGAQDCCAVPGCGEPGEYKAPLAPANFDGPGSWRFLCLDHVREHNAKYNFFVGMSAEEITAAQSSIAGWERTSRPFAHVGG
ncbi:MAG: molecular chaperone DnaJ, partial [Sphingomicrobium sp.]